MTQWYERVALAKDTNNAVKYEEESNLSTGEVSSRQNLSFSVRAFLIENTTPVI